MCFEAQVRRRFGKERKIVTISTTSPTSSCSRSIKKSMSQGGEPTKMLEDVKDSIKAFLNMEEMVKILYEERNTKLQGEISRPPRGECSPREEGNKNGDKPPSSPQYSCFSTTLMQGSSVESPLEKEDRQVCSFSPHDVEDEVLLAPKFKELKEESQRV